MPKRSKAIKPGNSQRERETSPRVKTKLKAKTSSGGRRSVSRGSVPQGRATKAAKIISLLRQPDGATLKAITLATGWQAHSVRGFISGQLVKKMKLRVKSVRQDGERVYAIKS